MGLEATSWGWLREGLLRVDRAAILERVENGVSAGMPDVNYVMGRTSGWIELKAVALPKNTGTPVLGREGLNLAQVNWHMARSSRGDNVWIFVSAAPYRWLLWGAHAKYINAMNAEGLRAHAAMWRCGVWNVEAWMKLREHLIHG